MKTRNKSAAKTNHSETPESGLIVVVSGTEPGIYRFADITQRKKILRDNAENRCREFSSDELEKAEEYLQRALDEAEARKYPLGYIAVRSGQFKGVYPYISPDERLKYMNKYHKYEIKDFPHYHFRGAAEEWTGESPVIKPMNGSDEISFLINRQLGYRTSHSAIESGKKRNEHDYEAALKFISGEDSRPHTGCHEHLEKIYESGNPAKFHGRVSSVESGNVIFSELKIICSNADIFEHDICIYNINNTFNFKEDQIVTFSAEVYEYITECGYIDYGIYELFDVFISME